MSHSSVILTFVAQENAILLDVGFATTQACDQHIFGKGNVLTCSYVFLLLYFPDKCFEKWLQNLSHISLGHCLDKRLCFLELIDLQKLSFRFLKQFIGTGQERLLFFERQFIEQCCIAKQIHEALIKE